MHSPAVNCVKFDLTGIATGSSLKQTAADEHPSVDNRQDLA